jgi:hypothetical protein
VSFEDEHSCAFSGLLSPIFVDTIGNGDAQERGW